ncbi:hypothetical protein HH303_18400 [Rhodospirillaceae bacterium KN72]|uniref:Uncharacterized protein n=1 Tax=Pacificispira spongiicola TaxID=2729598 RepID=A0A7Y0E3E9_9PROT|nr:hypothetical protein [Pacificispira spongiicola]NMM46468.1 hypothetical protein [Pacificispira spongiicola]
MSKDDDSFGGREVDISALAFTTEEQADRHDQGNWPEVFGLVLTIVVCWLIFGFTG